MIRLFRSRFLLLAAVVLGGLTHDLAAAVRDFELLSINSDGAASGSGASLNPVVSSNGQFVAFVSDAGNLVANDSNGMRDVFWRDRVGGTTRLVSRTAAGASGDGDSDSPVISADGRYVAFHSRAGNLVANDANSSYDVFLWDAHDNTVTLVSRTAAGASGAGDSFVPRMSASGRVVAFLSLAPDLVPNDTNATADAFAFNVDTTVMLLASGNPSGRSGNGFTSVPAISADGRHVAFLSEASDLVTNDLNSVEDVFVRDLQLGVTRLVSANVAGTDGGSRRSFDPVISADGRFVAFASLATNLVSVPDLNNFPDIFVRDMQLGTTKLASINRLGTAAGSNGGNPAVRPLSFKPVLSADGTQVLFESAAADLAVGDNNGGRDVFLRDLVNDTTLLISSNRFGTGAAAGLSAISPYSLSADLRYVALLSDAPDLGAADTNGKTDVFLRDLMTGRTKIISRVNLGGFAASGHSFQPVISADGSTIIFTTEAENLDDRDANLAKDVFAASTALGAPNFGVVDVGVGISTVTPQMVGSSFTLAITVTNHSAAPATGVVLTNSGPAFLEFLSATVSQGSIGTNDWVVGDLAANGSATATVTLVATNQGVGSVIVSIVERDQFDSNPGNDTASSTITASMSAGGALFHLPGSTPYLSRTNSPFFAGILSGAVTLETFERGNFSSAGVTASAGTNLAPSAITDSVDADDGAVDGSGAGGKSFFVTGTNAVTFSFNAAVLGRLPTKVGIVLTDGDPTGAGIEAFDTNGVSVGVLGPFALGDLAFNGETAEDRFLGVELAGGISALRVFYASAGFELDHLQFDIPTTDLAMSGTGPATATSGSNFVLTLTLTNLGLLTATGVVVTNADPGEVDFVSVTTSQGTVNPTNGEWTVGTLAAGAGATFTATLTPQGSGFLLFRAGATSALPDAHTGNDIVSLGVTVPNLPPGISFASNTLVLPEDSPALSFPAFVQISPQETNQNITNVTVAADNRTLFAVQPGFQTNGTLNLTLAANAVGTAIVTVIATDDGGTLGGGVPTGTNAFTIVVTNVNDAPAFGFSTNLVVVLEDAGGQSLAGFITGLSVGPANDSGQSITNYLVTTSSNALFSTLPAIALNGTLTFTSATNANGSVTVTVIAQDDGGTANGGVDRTTNTFTLTVTAVNDAPSLAFTTNNVVVLEESGSQLVAGLVVATLGPVDEAGQAITNYSVSSDQPALFSVVPAISLGGDLTFTPATNAYGVATLTVIAEDSGGTTNGGMNRTTNSFTITITNVNDAPSVILAASLVGVLEDGGAFTGGAGFVTLFSSGPANESGQTLVGYTVSNNNNPLFSVQPAINTAGVLTFTPSANSNGVATVTVIAQDDGGTANAGVNKTTNTFTIAVTNVNDAPLVTLATNLVVVAENAGSQNVASFIVVVPGPADESGQTVTNNVSVSNDHPGLFSVAPFLTPAGTLSFSLASNTNGSATVTIIAQDNGGTANGGVDRTTNTFTLSVTPAGSTNFTWLGGTGDWHNPAQWSPAGVPGLLDTAIITGGTVQLTNAVTVRGVSLASGTVTGAGSLTVSLNLSWTSGTFDGTGALIISTGATATASTTSTKVLRRQVDNAGTFTWTGGTIQANNNPTFNNQAGAVFDVQTDNTFFSTTDSSVRTFNNAGTVRKSAGATTTTWEGVLNNLGTVEVQTGTLVLTGSGLSSGTFTNVAGTVLAWTSGAHELTNGVTFTGLGTRRIAGGTLVVTAGTTVSPTGTFELVNGTLGGAGNFTLQAGSQFNWTAGTMATGGVFTVAAGGALTASTTSTKTLRRQVDNAGTFMWTGGTIQANDNPTFNNQTGALFDVQTDNTFFSTTDSSVRTLNNAGVVRKSAGATTTTWEGVFNNIGTVEMTAGTLVFNGSGLSAGSFVSAAGTVLAWTSGLHEVTNGTTFTGEGTRRIAGGTLLVSVASSISHEGTFELINGTLAGAGNFTVPAGSQFNWTAGTMATGGVFTVAAGGMLTASTTSTKVLRRQLNNAGTFTWTGGVIQANDNPTFNNQGGALFDVQVDTTFFSTTDSSVRTFNNAGTVRKSAGATTTTWEAVLNHSGTVEVQTGTLSLTGGGLSSGAFENSAGAVLVWASGTHQLTNGVTFTGPGTRRIAGGTLSVSTGATVSHEGTFELVNGTLGGAGNFTVPAGSQFNWTAGAMATGGVFTVAAGGALTASTTSTKTLRRQVNNAGTFTWTGGTIQANDNPTFNNQAGAVFDVQTDNTFFSTTDSSVRTFNNAGLVRKSAGATTTTWEGVLNNTGTLAVQTGTLSLTGSGLSSGAFVNTAGTVLSWNGTHELTNGTTFTGIGMRRIAGGTLSVSTGATISHEGTFELVNGTLGGAGNFTVPSGSVFNWTAGTMATGGVFTVAAGGTLAMSSTGTKTLRRQFDNHGTVTWSGGTVQGNSNPTFNNQAGAVFEIQADGNFFQTTDSSTRVFNNAGTLRKSAGTGFTSWEGTLNNTGLLEIRQGTFNLLSPYAPDASSALTVFLGGTTAGTQFGRLTVGGATTFAGTLNVVLTNSFSPGLSNSFVVVDSSGGGSGAFTATTGRAIAGGLVFETNYSGGDLTLQALAVNSAPTFTLTNFPAGDGVLDWQRDASTNAALGVKVAVDGSGNVIVAGDEYLGQDYNIVVAKYSPTGTLLWTNSFTGSPGGTDQVKGLALDSAGNVLVTGFAISSTYDYVTLKYSAAGTPVWTNFFDNGGDDTPHAIAVDSAGNVIVTGQSANGQYADYLTIKYQADGTPVWTNRSTYAGPGTDVARSVAVDTSGDVYVTGEGSNTDYNFAYTLKFAGATGTPVWTNQFDINGDNSYGVAVAVDNNGDVLVAANYLEVFVKFAVIKYTAAGVPVWTNLYDRATSHDQHIRAMAVDGSGNAIVTGETYNGTDFDYTTLKVLSSGVAAWTNHYDGVGGGVADYPLAITVNASADVFVTGHSTRTNGKDFLTVKYTAAGAGVWTNRYNGASNGDDQANAVAADASGNVFVTGAVGDPVATSILRTIKYAVTASPGAGQLVANTVGAVTVPGFVVSSSVGTTNESTQTFSFVVTNDNNALFSVQPAISPAGVLTYTVNAGVSGVAVVTVRAQDTGGAANGGVDTSAPQSFTITVVPGAGGVAYVWSGGTVNWNDPIGWTPNGVPGVADTATISSGTAQLTNAVSVSTLTLAGGTIGGAGSLTVRSAMNWTAGTMSGAGITTIANGAVLTVSGAVDKDLRRRLDNYGTVTWTAGRILGHDAAVIYNYAGALFDTQSEATLFESGDGTTKTFNNFGTVRKSAGTGTSAWSGSFNNSGTVNVQTGTLNPSGTVTLNNSSYIGNGQFMLTGATLAGTLTIAAGADVDFASGTLSGTGTIVGTMSWTGGAMGSGGTTTIATNGVLLISGATDKDLRRTLDNYGTVTWTGARILGHQAPVIINRAGALFDAQANTTLYESGDGTIKTFNNLGTVRRTVGTGSTVWNGRFNNDAVLRVETGVAALNGGGTSGGTFTNLAGATLEFSGGTHTLNHGAIFTGAGTNLIDGGTVNVSAGATATATGIIGLATGALGGTGTLLVASGGQFNWIGGTMDGTTGITLITNGATLFVSSVADKDLRRRLDNYGTVTWTAGRILGHATPTLNNYAGALLDTQTDATLFESGDGTIKTFNNFGTVRKSGGTGTSTWNGTFNHSGTADVQTGTLNPDGAVTLGTSSYSGAGRYLITGATLAGTLTIASGANVEISGNSVGGSGTLVGTLNWTSGTLGTGGTLTIATNGVLVASGVADKDLRQTVDNYGTVSWTGGRIIGHSTPVIVNRAGALFDAQANTTLFESADGTTKTFNNSGTVRRTVGTGTTLWNGLFNNNAVLRVETGRVALEGGGTSSGAFTNLAGATLEFSGGTHTLTDGASFTGAGTNLIDGGTVNVSTNATATVTGTFTLSTGTLGGTGTFLVTAGSQFNWTGGTMAGTTGITTITNGATLIASTGTDKDLRRRLDNHGTVTWTAGRILGHATPIINNLAGGLFDVQVDTTLFDSADGTIKTFNNSGTLRKSAGTGTTTVYGAFNLGGTANVQTGTLNPIGTVTASSASYSGAGRFLFTSGTLTGTQTVAGGANVELASGSLLGNWTLAGTMNWTGGLLGSGGATTIPAGSTLLVSGTGDKDLRRTLNNSGTVLWTGGRILGHSTPVFNNQAGAILEMQSDNTLYESGDSTIKTLNNSGTVRKSAGTGATTLNGTFNNTGVLEIRSGVVSVDAGYAPGAASSLRVFLGGLTAGTQFGQLRVEGGVTLNGTLAIVLTNGFVPASGNSFLVVDSGSGSGTFSALTGDDLGGGLTLDPTYLLGDVTLMASMVSSLPPLSPQASGAERLLRWPGDAAGYELQTAPAITGPWTPVLAPVAQENGASVVRLPAEGTRFYRLVPVAPPRPGDNPTQ